MTFGQLCKLHIRTTDEQDYDAHRRLQVATLDLPVELKGRLFTLPLDCRRRLHCQKFPPVISSDRNYLQKTVKTSYRTSSHRYKHLVVNQLRRKWIVYSKHCQLKIFTFRDRICDLRQTDRSFKLLTWNSACQQAETHSLAVIPAVHPPPRRDEQRLKDVLILPAMSSLPGTCRSHFFPPLAMGAYTDAQHLWQRAFEQGPKRWRETIPLRETIQVFAAGSPLITLGGRPRRMVSVRTDILTLFWCFYALGLHYQYINNRINKLQSSHVIMCMVEL